jgi:hypothetical protein
MEELFKLMCMSMYLQESNLKDSTTLARIKQLDAEAKELTKKLSQQWLNEKFK